MERVDANLVGLVAKDFFSCPGGARRAEDVDDILLVDESWPLIFLSFYRLFKPSIDRRGGSCIPVVMEDATNNLALPT